MVQRKVMKLGKSSLVVSLPKDWIQMLKLEPGDLLDLKIQPNRSLTVFPVGEDNETPKTITLHIDSDENKNSIMRTIIACYLYGYSKIRFISRKIFTGDQQKVMRRIARKLYINIIESTSNNIIMEILSDETKTSVISNLNRMYIISKSMIKDAMSALRERNGDLARSVFFMDDDVDHFCFFLLRIIRKASIDPVTAKKLKLSQNDVLDFQTIAYRIESIADHAAEIAKQTFLLAEASLEIPTQLLDMIYAYGMAVIEKYQKALEAFFSNNPAICNSVIESAKELEEQSRKIAQETFKTEGIDAASVCAMCSIRDSIGRIFEWSKSIAETTILRSYYE